jgi:nucleoside phosphorylase
MHAADILIVTVLPEEYSAVVSQLTDARLARGTANAPNTHSWRLGTIAHAGGGAYRVAVALVGSAGNVNASQAVASSVARWKPRHVLLVGIAGGLSTAGCIVGDVVVATEVYGYEYGKLDAGFHARPNWTFQVDAALRASAQGFAATNPKWGEEAAGRSPRVLFGPVASGDKVVDDPSDPLFAEVLRVWPKLHAVEMEGAGAAAAIEYLRTAGTQVGFLMVRGISDTPREPGERFAVGAQSGERDANKSRACEVAARFVARWIATEWPIEPSAAVLPDREVGSAPAQGLPGASGATRDPSQSRAVNEGPATKLEPLDASRLEAASNPIV